MNLFGSVRMIETLPMETEDSKSAIHTQNNIRRRNQKHVYRLKFANVRFSVWNQQCQQFHTQKFNQNDRIESKFGKIARKSSANTFISSQP